MDNARANLTQAFRDLLKMVLRLDTGFSNGWKETFMSGDQEPWVFRGGLTADLQVHIICLSRFTLSLLLQ